MSWGSDMKKTSMIFLILALLVVSGCSLIAPVDAVDPANTEPVIFEVSQGSALTAIAKQLKAQDLIMSELGFKQQAKQMAADTAMKAGKYELNKSMTASQIIEKMVAGDVYVEKIKVVIPEGYELKQIEERLIEAGLIDKDAFEKAMTVGQYDFPFASELPDGKNRMEGFIFPATYQIPKNATEEEIITMMLSAFNKNFKEAYYARAKEVNLSVLEVVTLASIVEREAKLDSERALIAGVFLNRLKVNKQLESCATVQYALGERKARLYNKDLQVDSPYNTYRHRGLPPGPIASPGVKAIEAVLYPEVSDYLYFRTTAKGDGSHDFSKTYQEHQLSGDGGITP